MVNVHSSAPEYGVPTRALFFNASLPAHLSPAVVSVDFALTSDFPEEPHPTSGELRRVADR